MKEYFMVWKNGENMDSYQGVNKFEKENELAVH